jgi:hypothetical protein
LPPPKVADATRAYLPPLSANAAVVAAMFEKLHPSVEVIHAGACTARSSIRVAITDPRHTSARHG